MNNRFSPIGKQDCFLIKKQLMDLQIQLILNLLKGLILSCCNLNGPDFSIHGLTHLTVFHVWCPSHGSLFLFLPTVFCLDRERTGKLALVLLVMKHGRLNLQIWSIAPPGRCLYCIKVIESIHFYQ